MTKYPLCFVAGTKVHTADGLKNIEEIRVGDVVVSRSEHDPSGDNSLRRVTDLFVTHPKRLLTVRYRTGDTVEELTGTATHPFFVREQAGFVPAEELKVGWHFSLVDGQEATIEEIRETVAEEGASFTTYNFSVEEEHTYFVGSAGVWVHNVGNPCDEAMEVFLKYLAATDNPIIAAQAARNHLVSKIDEATEGAALYQKHLDDLDRLMYDEILKAGNSKHIDEYAQWLSKASHNRSAFSPLHASWYKHIDGVVDDLVASGRPKVIVLGEGGQGKIASFVNRDPRKVTEFLELRPKSLDYTNAFKAGRGTEVMEVETLEFNIALIVRLKQRGFQFEVLGDITKSSAAKSAWLRAELEVIESLGGSWKTIPQSRIDEVMKLAPWGRPRRY